MRDRSRVIDGGAAHRPHADRQLFASKPSDAGATVLSENFSRVPCVTRPAPSMNALYLLRTTLRFEVQNPVSTMIRTSLLGIFASVAASTPVLAQSFNLNVGTTQNHCPTNAYAAAANQPGFWLAVRTDSHPVVPLTDVNGNPTTATISETGGNGDFSILNPNWSGNDALLLDYASDCGDIGGSIVWTINGLAAGNYSIFTYAEAPDFPDLYRTNVSVLGAAQGTQLVGGAWTGSPHVQGVTYALHTVTVAAGAQVKITTSTAGAPVGNLGTCNGFQIRKEGGGGGGTGTPFCFGDGTLATPCPCANSGSAGHGCQNSASTGGALLAATGATVPDSLVLHSSAELPTALTIFLQGDANLSTGIVFGDGVRCANGNLKRLASKTAIGGATSYPQAGDLSISVESAILGDPIPAGATRYYQVYYRDANASFCPAPQGSTFNSSNGLIISW
jgi:hypothetical protein